MVLPCTPMPSDLPPLRPWSKSEQNRCEYYDIPSYWTAHEAVTFLIDLNGYRPALNDFLTDDEMAQVLRRRPAIAQRRFVLSRAILKRVLSEIFRTDNITEITLTRNVDGRVLVDDKPNIFVSLSYYGTSIAMTLGKMKLGSDIEGVRPIRGTKITASPLFGCYPSAEGSGEVQQVIHVWTLVESYAKLFDTNSYSVLNHRSPLPDAEIVSYFIDHRMIFSLAAKQSGLTDVLVWLDL